MYKGSDGLEHGLIASLTEASGNYQNQMQYSLVGASRSDDGLFNTSAMTNSTAKSYINTLGAGWYLPSLDELILLFNNRFYIQKILRLAGNIQLSSTSVYWSSTEINSDNAHIYTLNWRLITEMLPALQAKFANQSVRAIKAF